MTRKSVVQELGTLGALLRASLDGLDTRCTERLRAPPFALPDGGG